MIRFFGCELFGVSIGLHMELIISTIAVAAMAVVISLGISAYRVVGAVCPSCGAAGGEEDPEGDLTSPAAPGEKRWMGFLAKKPVTAMWCAKCGHKWRIVK